jgi:GNAT superfamily N-acetyltransferase
MIYKNLTKENIAEEHICCAFSDKKCADGYQMKKDWLSAEFAHGYTFRKLDERGKIFIEYVPIEHAWLPLEGKNFMVINCFWVSGKFKGNGHGKALLQSCIDDAKAKGMDGIVAISGDKKRPFMSDPKFYKLQGFEIVDEAPPFFKLYGMRFDDAVAWPQIKASAKQGTCPDKDGISVYYSNTCPFTDLWANMKLQEYADSKGVPLSIHHIKTKEDAQAMPIPSIINSIFYKGELVTLELKPDRHLDKLLEE